MLWVGGQLSRFTEPETGSPLPVPLTPALEDMTTVRCSHLTLTNTQGQVNTIITSPI